MKNLFLTFSILIFTSTICLAQTKTRIHFLNKTSPFFIQKTDKSLIKIKLYSLIESLSDSLTFVDKSQYYVLPLEKNKDSYFIIHRSLQSSATFIDSFSKVEEVSETVFILTLLANKMQATPNFSYTY